MAPHSANVTRSADDSDTAFLKTLTGCRLCEGRMDDPRDDKANGICWSCKGRPEAARLQGRVPAAKGIAPLRPPASGPRAVKTRPAFTAADKSMIKRLAPVLPVADLLRLLNERLEANDPDSLPYALEQLQAELPQAISIDAGADWAGLRKLLATARRSGVLAQITPQVLADFSVLFSLTPAQVLRLNDVLARAKDPR
jgi:hypothetical protein